MGIERLIGRLDAAVGLGDIERVTAQIKSDLEGLSRCGELQLPEAMTRCCDDTYARRLLHRNDNLGYTVVVMTWGPGQGTDLHDHAGIWCVECVVRGELDVTQYDMVERQDRLCRFREMSRVRAGVGHAGCLIPPFEYHVLANARADHASVTLHVYGGEMDRCNLYVPQTDGWWEPQARSLSYDA